MKYLKVVSVLVGCFLAAASVQAMDESATDERREEDVYHRYIQARALVESDDSDEQGEGIKRLAELANREKPHLPAVHRLFQELSEGHLWPEARQVLENIFNRDTEDREKQVKGIGRWYYRVRPA